jgi:hypothetical protein
MAKASLGALLASLLVCVPCLLTVVAAVGGLAVLSAAGGWLADNALVTVLGAGGVTLSLVFGVLIYRQRRRAACEVGSPEPPIESNPVAALPL